MFKLQRLTNDTCRQYAVCQATAREEITVFVGGYT